MQNLQETVHKKMKPDIFCLFSIMVQMLLAWFCKHAELRNDEADAGLVLGDDAAELSKRSAADRGNCISLWALVLNTELEELQGPSCPP